MQPSAVLLHYRTGDYVLIGFHQFCQFRSARFHYSCCPVVHFSLLVRVAPYHRLNCIFDYLTDVVDDELTLLLDILFDIHLFHAC